MNGILEGRLRSIENLFREAGYTEEQGGSIASNYGFQVRNKMQRVADLIAFADPQLQDISTACIAVQHWSNGQNKAAKLADLSFIAAPIAVLAHENYVEVGPVVPELKNVDVNSLKRYSYEDLPEYFRRNQNQLSPRSLLKVKRGERQFNLFESDPSFLQEFAREVTKKELVKAFESAVASVSEQVRLQSGEAMHRVAIWILMARILQDKLPLINDTFSDLRVTEPFELLANAGHHFPNFFEGLDGSLARIGREAVENFYSALSRDFTFRSLTNDSLAYFYENTFVSSDKETRKQFGVYYTPRHLTELILKRLPIEEIPLEDRTVLDGTCGSGNLLLSAYDRLSDLLPYRWDAERRDTYLQQHIWGIDVDSFACDVARMSLFLYNFPQENNWRLNNKDVFGVDPIKEFGVAPHIIVGNPPFRERRSQPGPPTQIAAQILERYVNWLAPGGLLGVVLPITLLHNDTGKSARRTLFSSCDVLEIWDLPERSIPSSSSGLAVVIAKKHPVARAGQKAFVSPNALTRVDKVVPTGKKDFEESYKVTSTTFVSAKSWENEPNYILNKSQFEDVIERMMSGNRLISQFCKIYNGIQPGAEGNRTLFHDSKINPDWQPVLRRNNDGKAFEPYIIRWDQQINSEPVHNFRNSRHSGQYMKYPDPGIHRPRKPIHFTQPEKVVLNGAQNSGKAWRVYAAIDRSHLLITENFHYILPTVQISAHELVALFNSMLVNIWYDSRHSQHNVQQKQLGMLPFAGFNEHQRSNIRRLVEKIMITKIG